MMNEEICRDIRQMVSGKVLSGERMSGYTSIGVGGPADVLVFPDGFEELGRLVSFLTARGTPFVTVGNWTNIIVRDGGYRGVVVSLKNLGAVSLREGTAGGPGVYAQAGANLSDLVSLSAEKGFAGLEFCAGIPGSVGGAVKMNAGAYGSEMKDVIQSVTLMDRSGHVRECDRDQLVFHYRRLDIPDEDVILAATFRLSPGQKDEITAKIREIVTKRRGKHPLEYKSAGSIFKNPQEKPAGRIIEDLGLKGMQVGGAKISEKHGNFIINTGTAQAKDVTMLIEIVQQAAYDRTGIRLEPEVVILGEEA